ncbi:hypothetical protein MD484_g805, partial [Candolleomyces efflorescens]
MVLGTGPINFDSSTVMTVQPGLASPQGYLLDQDELQTIFGIDSSQFGALPSRIVVPVLEAQPYTEGWSVINGFLYLVVPEAWVPHICHGETIPASKFTAEHCTMETKSVSEGIFNAGTSAALDIGFGGSLVDLSVKVKSSGNINLKVTTSPSVIQATTATGATGDVSIHELMAYPILKCKVIKKQRVEFIVNEEGGLLQWGSQWGLKSPNSAFWNERRVEGPRLSEEVKKLIYHPVPLSDKGVAEKTWLLPVPQLTSDGDIEVTTLLSYRGWPNWFHYDAPWENCSDLSIQLAAPNNSVGFRPMANWVIFKGVDLFEAIHTLEGLERLSQEEQGSADSVVSDKIRDLIATLRAKADLQEPLTYSFSNIDFDFLDEQLHIVPGDTLVRRGNHAARAVESAAQGGTAYMTSEDLYRHLDMLENLVPKSNGTGARLWIDAILFRVKAMLPNNKNMLLNVKQHIPSVGIPVPGQAPFKLGGTMVDYAVLSTDSRKHESFIQTSQIQYVKHQNPNGLFITEAKHDSGVPLSQQVPQAVAELYTSAKYLTKRISRGALTNGHEWIFIILYLNEDGVGIGGTYAASPPIKIQVSESYPFRVLSPGPDIVAGILAYWVCLISLSFPDFDDLDQNDWFSLLSKVE